MAGQTITIGGHSVNDLFWVSGFHADVPEFSPYTVDLVGGGVASNSMRRGTATVTIGLVVLPGRSPRDAISTLLSWLDVDGPLWLSASDLGDRVMRVVAEGSPVIEDDEYGDVLTLELLQVDPYLYGAQRTLTMTGATTIAVGGDCPTMPIVSCPEAIRRTNDDLWGLSLDGGATEMYVKVGTPLATSVSIDCEAKAVTVGTDHSMITLESDWLVLTPGTHTVAFGAGSGTTTITWREMWHR